jgi:hypothetical protein
MRSYLVSTTCSAGLLHSAKQRLGKLQTIVLAIFVRRSCEQNLRRIPFAMKKIRSRARRAEFQFVAWWAAEHGLLPLFYDFVLVRGGAWKDGDEL